MNSDQIEQAAPEQQREAIKVSLWVDQQQRTLVWPMSNGNYHATFPKVMTAEEIDALEQVLAITIAGLRKTSEDIAAAIARSREP